MYYTDSVIEESTLQKLSLHLLPLLCLVSMAGMLLPLSLPYAQPAIGPALSLTAAQLRLADHLFCAGYLLASLPAAWLLLRFATRTWIAAIVLASGGIAMAHALVWDAASLYAARFALGAAEAGLLPAMVFYLTQWMPDHYRARAIAALVAAAALVPVFSGAASDFLLLLARWFGIGDWRFLFVVEGLPMLWLGLHVPARLPRAPADAAWLPASERIWLQGQLRRTLPAPAAVRFADGLRSAPIWKLAAVQVIIGLVAGSLGMWVPLAMQQSGYVPPAIAAAIMIGASVAGAAGAAVAGVLPSRRSMWRGILAASLALAGICLGTAALLPYGHVGVAMLAIVAAGVPVILALTWVLAPCVVAGAAAAAGFGVLGMAGMLGVFAAGGLTVLRSDAGARCVVLAVACLVAAWLARGLEGRRPAGMAASAASPGE